MQVVLLGGSFDPVHCGHVALADAVQQTLDPDLLLWVPAAVAPHKTAQPPSPAQQRLALLKQIVAARGGEETWAWELQQPPPSFTVDTLEECARRRPEAQLFLAMGEDSFRNLATWRRLERVLELAELLVAPRHGSRAAVLAVVRDALPASCQQRLRMRALPMETVDVSSSALRQRLLRGESCAGLLPPQVEEQIRRHGWYRGGA